MQTQKYFALLFNLAVSTAITVNRIFQFHHLLCVQRPCVVSDDLRILHDSTVMTLLLALFQFRRVKKSYYLVCARYCT